MESRAALSETPRLETQRLILRGWRGDDIDSFAAMMADVEVARFLSTSGQVPDRASVWSTMAMYAGQWVLRGFGLFVVEEKGTGAFVGRVGPWLPEDWLGVELGWAVAREHWGKGYAYEAARAAGSWAFETLNFDKLISLTHVDNARSQRLAQRFGMTRAAETLHAGMPHTLWSVTRADWR